MTKYDILGKIQHGLNKSIGMKNTPNATIQDIRNIMDNEMLKNMLELQSCVMAHGLYQQILIDKEKGLTNLDNFMRTPLSPNKIPDFSFIGLDRQTLLQVSKDMVTATENEKINSSSK